MSEGMLVAERDAAIRRAEAAEEKAASRGRTIKMLQDALALKNLQLDSLHYVWCDGGCGSGVHRYEDQRGQPVTAELVAQAIWNTVRLKRWYVNHAGKEYMQPRTKAVSGSCGLYPTWKREDVERIWAKAKKAIEEEVETIAALNSLGESFYNPHPLDNGPS